MNLLRKLCSDVEISAGGKKLMGKETMSDGSAYRMFQKLLGPIVVCPTIGLKILRE